MPRRAKITSKIPATLRNRSRLQLVLIALVLAAGLTWAVATFAATTVWSATGIQGLCHSSMCVGAGSEQVTYTAGEFGYHLNMRPGTYKVLVRYHSPGINMPEGATHHLEIVANGKVVDTGDTPVSEQVFTYGSDDFQVAQPLRSLSVRWTNDYYAPPSDINFALTDVTLQRIDSKVPPKKPPKPKPKAPPNSSAGWAAALLADNGNRVNISGVARRELELARDGKCVPVKAVSARACTKLDKRILKAVYNVSRKHKLYIWEWVAGPHVACSNHYEGRAVDLKEFNEAWPKNRALLSQFAKQGTQERLGPGDPGHTDHWHVAFNGPHRNCRR